VDKLKPSGKPFDISKWEVWEAYRQVKANQGAPGVDGVTLEVFEKDRKNNLYKIWNRMSSGSYFPPPVKAVEIPKPHGGGTRTLGVPTIADRVAQTVVARRLEAKVEPIFHPDSYGYRPRRSALDAVAACRERCWKSNWVIDLDIQKFFDSVDHALMVKAVEAHADVPWVVLYVKRWLSAPLALPDGTLRQRDRGTPQGSAVSPVLANLFMHYAFDMWMAREYPGIRFERYADDAVVHCVTERQARNLVAAIGDRMEQVGLRLHPDKTKVVYCQDGNRRLDYGLTAFTFLGFTFRARAARTKRGIMFVAFQPAISKDAQNKISGQIRRWRLHRWIGLNLAELARQINPVVRGWMQYYGAFYRSALNPLLSRINAYVMRWIRNKYKRLRTTKKAKACWQRITRQHPRLFAHWAWVHGSWWSR
jgi:RNA-directed DNA polymerase